MKRILTFFFLFVAFLAQAQFTPGRIVVTQVGDGTTLSGNTFPVSILEFDISTANQAIPTPKVSLGTTTAGSRLTTGGNVAQMGQLSLSADGKYLTLVGYDMTSGTANPTTTTVNKVIARIDASGAVNYTTNFPTAANGTARSVVSDDGTKFWTSLDNIGYETFGQTTTPTSVATGTPRVLNIYNGQLFYYTSFGNILKTNTALPTTSSTTTNAVILSPALSSNGFVFFDLDPNIGWDNTGFDLLYLSNSSSGLEKYYYDTTTSSWLPVHSQYQLTIAITSGGSGYSSAPTVKIGTDWQANTAYTVGQQVLGTSGAGLGRLYTVTIAGTSGTTSPVHTTSTATNGGVTFSHAAASPNAAATAIITGGVVTGVTITTQQNGYTTGATPTVTFSGGGGSGATATATVTSTVFNGSGNNSLAQLTGKLINGVPTLFATTGIGTATANKLIKIADNSGRTGTMTNVLSPATVLATAATNYAFRGVAFSTETPIITASTNTLSGFSTIQGTASTTQSYTVRGSYLGTDITITAPTGYEISKTSSSAGFATTQTLTNNSGTVPLKTIYVRLTGATIGTPSGNITHTSTGATTQNIALSGTVTGALPVNLVSFQGLLIENEIVLEWKTTSESNIKNFVVEKSLNAQSFEAIGTTAPSNTKQLNSYTFTDKNTTEEIYYYYRLRTLDNDETFSLSRVIALKREPINTFKLSVWPNPISDFITASYGVLEQDATLFVEDLTGKIIINKILSKGSSQVSFDVSALPIGAYVMVLQSQNKPLHTVKLLK